MYWIFQIAKKIKLFKFVYNAVAAVAYTGL